METENTNTMYNYQAKIIKVIDGDTMDFEVDLGFKIKHTIRVRLHGIDTPEIYHPRNEAERGHGEAAKQFVIDKFMGLWGVLTTRKDKKGKYGRYLASFVLQGLDLAQALKDNGFKKKQAADYEINKEALS